MTAVPEALTISMPPPCPAEPVADVLSVARAIISSVKQRREKVHLERAVKHRRYSA